MKFGYVINRNNTKSYYITLNIKKNERDIYIFPFQLM